MNERPPKKTGREPFDKDKVVVVARVRPKSKSERRLEREALRNEYMSSPIIMWAEFARSKGLDPYPKGRNSPSILWQQQKKDAYSAKEADELAGAMFSQGHRWNKALVKTLDDYPKTIDTLYEVTKRKIATIVDIANKAEQGNIDAVKKFADIKPSDLQTIANTLETLTRAKHKSLMIEGWDVKLAKQVLGEQEDITKQLSDATWTIEVFGKDIEGKEVQKRISDWYDRPQNVVDADITGGNIINTSASGDSEPED